MKGFCQPRESCWESWARLGCRGVASAGLRLQAVFSCTLITGRKVITMALCHFLSLHVSPARNVPTAPYYPTASRGLTKAGAAAGRPPLAAMRALCAQSYCRIKKIILRLLKTGMDVSHAGQPKGYWSFAQLCWRYFRSKESMSLPGRRVHVGKRRSSPLRTEARTCVTKLQHRTSRP